MAVTEESSSYALTPAEQPDRSYTGEYDSELVLNNGDITTTAATTAINVEGGVDADVVLVFGAITGTNPTLSVVVQASIDGGSNYFHIGQFPAFAAADASTPFARKVRIPNVTSATNRLAKVRLSNTIGGTDTPTFPLLAYLRPCQYGTDEALEALT
ncbi:MAG: hypothetical protein AB7Q01_08410 [Gammaproteobacteria bacterium]